MAAPVPRNSSPQLSTTSDSDEDEEFDLEKSSFYVEESSRSRQRPPAEPHSPAQWSQLRQLVISDTRSAGTSPASLAPPEILIHIFRLIPATKDLHSALLVSRAWCQCAVELMWHKPHFAKLNSLIKMIHAINHQEQTFQYATFVRRLNFAAQSNELSDQLFSRLAPCIRLERLTLIKCDQLTDEGLMRVFKACPSLIALDLTEVTAVTDQSIEVLAANAPRLQGINVCHCKNITDAGVAALALNCPQLRRIKLHGLVHLTNTPVSILARSCPLLLEIDLNFCTHVSDLAVRELWRHTRLLRELRLSHVNALSDAAFPVPIHASTTSHVFPTTSANATPPTPYNPSRLPPYTIAHQFDHLRTLDLTACHQLTDDALEGIVCNTPKIRQLVLAKCSLLTDDALISISKLGRHLHYLHLGHVTNITDKGVTRLARACTRLRYLDLACCQNLTDLSVLELSVLPKLRRIGLVRVPNLTDQAVMALGERHTCLERIHLSYCEQITVPAVDFLLQKLPHLTHLSLTGIPAFLRQDIQSFCRTPPRELTSPQRTAFCVYSGKGVHDLKRFFEQARKHSLQSQHEVRSLPEDGLIEFGPQQHYRRHGPPGRVPPGFPPELLQDRRALNTLHLDQWAQAASPVFQGFPGPSSSQRRYDRHHGPPVDSHAHSHSAPLPDTFDGMRGPHSHPHRSTTPRPTLAIESRQVSTASSNSSVSGDPRVQGYGVPEGMNNGEDSFSSSSMVRPTRGREARRGDPSSSSQPNARSHPNTFITTSAPRPTYPYPPNGSTGRFPAATSPFAPNGEYRPPYVEPEDIEEGLASQSPNGLNVPMTYRPSERSGHRSNSLTLPESSEGGEQGRRRTQSVLRNAFQATSSVLMGRSPSRSPAPPQDRARGNMDVDRTYEV